MVVILSPSPKAEYVAKISTEASVKGKISSLLKDQSVIAPTVNVPAAPNNTTVANNAVATFLL